MLDLKALPKVLLHDHLDGGLRPETVLDLAAASGYRDLPSDDVDELAAWFHQADSTSLERYLATFAHTCGVMQDAASLERVAYEAVEDLSADGVVYAESRFAPSLSTAGDLDRVGVMEAVLAGLRRGEADFGLPVRLIVDAMRQDTDSAEVATAAARLAHEGVVGFDLAGPEAGFPASEHREAIGIAVDAGLRVTLHAGEGHFGGEAGVASIVDALGLPIDRIGHGVRLVDDMKIIDGEVVDMGLVATRVHEEQIALEMCPTSNLHINAVSAPEHHPIGIFHRAGFNVTVNTDNRLMSSTSMTDEFSLVVEHHRFTKDDLETVTRRATDAAFCDESTRRAVRDRVAAGYAYRRAL